LHTLNGSRGDCKSPGARDGGAGREGFRAKGKGKTVPPFVKDAKDGARLDGGRSSEATLKSISHPSHFPSLPTQLTKNPAVQRIGSYGTDLRMLSAILRINFSMTLLGSRCTTKFYEYRDFPRQRTPFVSPFSGQGQGKGSRATFLSRLKPGPPETQPSRAGLTCGAPLALGEGGGSGAATDREMTRRERGKADPLLRSG
jgi:hypothetical protein